MLIRAQIWVVSIVFFSLSGQSVAAGQESAPAASCPPEANLLRDAQFASIRGEGKRVWSSRQHARGNDFRYSAEEDRLTIKKIGKEPWFVLTQRLTETLPANSELQFDATLELDTREPAHVHEFGYVSGLYLVAKAGRKEVIRMQADHDPRLGRHPATHVVMTAGTDRVLTWVEAGFIHQSDGAFTIRHPRLINLSQFPVCRLH